MFECAERYHGKVFATSPKSFKMAAMEALASAYGDDSDSGESGDNVEKLTEDHTAHLNPGRSINDLKSNFNLDSAPSVSSKVILISTRSTFQDRYDDLMRECSAIV